MIFSAPPVFRHSKSAPPREQSLRLGGRAASGPGCPGPGALRERPTSREFSSRKMLGVFQFLSLFSAEKWTEKSLDLGKCIEVHIYGLELLQKSVGRNVEIQKGKSESPGFAEASQLEIGDHGDILHHFVIRDFSKTPMDKFFQTSSRLYHTLPRLSRRIRRIVLNDVGNSICSSSWLPI